MLHPLPGRVPHRPFPAATAEMVDGPVATDGKQPGAEPVVDRFLRFTAEFEKRVLDSVVGQVEVADESAGVAEERRFVALHRPHYPGLRVIGRDRRRRSEPAADPVRRGERPDWS